jgi:hypothetical protein
MNRVPSMAIKGQLPYQLLYGKLPDLSLLRVFGCLCYTSTHDVQRSKLDHRSLKYVFLGYKAGMKGFTVLALHSGAILTSRNVQFEELIFPYSPSTPSWEYIDPTIHAHLASAPLLYDDFTNPNSIIHTTAPDQQVITPAAPVQHAIPSTPPPVRKSSRLTKPPSHLADYVRSTYIAHSTPYPLSKYTSHAHLSKDQLAYTLSLLTDVEPSSYTEACKHDCWVKAMQSELQALQQNQTWIIVPLPSGIKPIGCKWVYKIKRKADGSIERYKARLVAKGYNQIEGVDYFETFSPVARMTTILTVLAIASINNWFVHQLDVNNAFLHGDLCEDVYMQIPQGLEGISAGHVCKLVKSLYGLKQASRKWYEKLTQSLLDLHFHPVPYDPTLFVKKTPTSFTALLICFDDIVLTGDNLTDIAAVKSHLHAAFGIKDLGVLKFFLGLEVAHSTKGISLS